MADQVKSLEGLPDDRYRIVREVGRGGMAIVWLAEEVKHGRKVAIKVLRPEVAETAGSERFLREIRVTAGLRHPNIVPLLDSGRAGQLPYFVMPYIEGQTLRDRLREGPLPVRDALAIAAEVADALDAAHGHGVVHRDIKPSNILLDAGHAVVTDFGIVRALAEAAGEELTTRGMMPGTPGYLSPEQAAGDEKVDGRCDIYALGCVLYEMLAGEPPFQAPSALALLAKHVSVPPPRVTTLRPAVPEHVDRVILKALAKNPADRFQTAGEFRDALREAEHTADLPAGSRFRLGGEGRRGRGWRVAAAVAAAAVVLAGAGVVGWRLVSGAPDLDPNRIVVFPPRSSGAVPREASMDVATVVGYTLEGTEPLHWIDASDRLTAAELDDPSGLAARRKLEVARELGAAYFLDGALTADADSLNLFLRLNDVARDSVLGQGHGVEARQGASLGRISLDAVRELLPALVGRPVPGERLDALADREPAAIVHWLRGERAYRASRMSEALDHYHRALAEDSLLVLAALGGAQAAIWDYLAAEARTLVDAALRHHELLPPRHEGLARGLSAYLEGQADASLRHIGAVLVEDPGWSEAWYLLGEISNHLLPSHPVLDSVAALGLEGALAAGPRSLPSLAHDVALNLGRGEPVARGRIAEAALRMARMLDPGFTPPVVHLAELAIRRGALDSARASMELWRSAAPDPHEVTRVEIQMRCVRDGPEAVDWEAQARADPLRLVQAGHVLAAGGAQLLCAERALRAVYDEEEANPNDRWGALLALQGVLFAQARWDELTALLRSSASAGLPGDGLHLLVADAGAPLDAEAREAVERQPRPLDSVGSPTLWLRLVWGTHVGDVQDVRTVASILRVRREDGRTPDDTLPGTRRDTLLAQVAAARLALVEGDRSTALRRLAALRPGAPWGELTWQPWESLGAERLLLARELLEDGRYREALDVASLLDHTEPVIYLIYLPGSLEVRIRAAEALGEPELAHLYRARLAALRPDAEGSRGRIPSPSSSSGGGP